MWSWRYDVCCQWDCSANRANYRPSVPSAIKELPVQQFAVCACGKDINGRYARPHGTRRRHDDSLGDWFRGPGSRYLFKDLAWALGHCRGIVSVIVAVRDRKVSPRVRMAECYPRRNLLMRVALRVSGELLNTAGSGRGPSSTARA